VYIDLRPPSLRHGQPREAQSDERSSEELGCRNSRSCVTYFTPDSARPPRRARGEARAVRRKSDPQHVQSPRSRARGLTWWWCRSRCKLSRTLYACTCACVTVDGPPTRGVRGPLWTKLHGPSAATASQVRLRTHSLIYSSLSACLWEPKLLSSSEHTAACPHQLWALTTAELSACVQVKSKSSQVKCRLAAPWAARDPRRTTAQCRVLAYLCARRQATRLSSPWAGSTIREGRRDC